MMPNIDGLELISLIKGKLDIPSYPGYLIVSAKNIRQEQSGRT